VKNLGYELQAPVRCGVSEPAIDVLILDAAEDRAAAGPARAGFFSAD